MSLTEHDERVLSWLAGEDAAEITARTAPAPEVQRPPRRRPRRWPIFLIASPAAVSIWSGWVGLGQMCGFGYVHPLPGIVPGFQLDTAITLPVGVEAYGAYALGVWLSAGTPRTARRFARWSAIGSLALGAAGQVIYHLLAAAGQLSAPWPVTVGVACLPVVALGFGAALVHLLHRPDDEPGDVPAVPEPPAVPGDEHAGAAEAFAAEILAGQLPGIRAIKDRLSVGQDKAQQVQAYLRQRMNGAS